MLSIFFSLVAGDDWQQTPHINVVNMGQQHDFDADFTWATTDGWFLCAMKSEFSQFHFDRKFEFHQCQWSLNPQARTTMALGWCNSYDGTMDCICPAGMGIVGWTSEHDNGFDDRRWKPVCGKSDDVKILPWDSNDAFARSEVSPADHGAHQIACHDNRVACGMEGSHIGKNGDVLWEDRSYQLRCCVLQTRVDECAAVEVKIHSWQITETEKPSDVSVDRLTLSGCGSDAEVSYELSKERSVEQELEEQITMSKTFEESFTKDMAIETSVTFSYTQAIDGGLVSSEKGVEFNFGASFSTSRTKTQGMSEEKMNRKRSMETSTFSSGYSFAASPGNIVSVDALQKQYKGRINWQGSATCYSAQGEVLATAPNVNGQYNAVGVSEVNIIHSTTICEVDGYDIHQDSYCKKTDWLKHDDTETYITTKTQQEALDWCELRGDCECVMDRGCNNAEDGFVLCATGCSKRLVPSTESCTLTQKNECRCAHPNGGPWNLAITCDDGFTASCGSNKICSTGSVSKDAYVYGNWNKLDESPLCLPLPIPSNPENAGSWTGGDWIDAEATCFTNGWHYVTFNGPTNTFRTMYNIYSALDCKKECQKADQCLYWSWRVAANEWGPENSCYLKTNIGTPTNTYPESVSGPKYCENEMSGNALVSRRRSDDTVRRLQG